ncbi:hypothetical protein BC943DRAFT_327128 [Umbelopsis sp. AD052]|nr:hypothetical protein BC943DRAFT_327128 [Umbelopsis sp. AD052]
MLFVKVLFAKKVFLRLMMERRCLITTCCCLKECRCLGVNDTKEKTTDYISTPVPNKIYRKPTQKPLFHFSYLIATRYNIGMS